MQQADSISHFKRVCEIGAGTGRFLSSIADISSHVDAFEPCGEMYKILQDRIVSWETEKCVAINDYFRPAADSYCAILLLTDTLSYVWPHEELQRLVGDIYSSLRRNGVLVIDIALWDSVIPPIRNEEWIEEQNGLKVKAKCSSEIFSEANNREWTRVETLSFEIMRDGRIHSEQESNEMQMFSFCSVQETFSSFKFLGWAKVGDVITQEHPPERQNRIMLAFSKPL